MKEYNFELLAPAGSYEGFQAALGAGADAVYVGGRAFGARAYAKNFDTQERLQAIDEAHIHGRKLYLTVNTLVKNRELEEQLYEYLLPFYEAGLDAVIIQDMGVFSFVRENFPGMHLHASTQMTVTGPAGMVFLQKQGASRVVTARELSLQELARMHAASSLEIEAFIHGALCYSISGQCLMSSLLGGRSGNRGRCAQPCRLSYRIGNSSDFSVRLKKSLAEQCLLSMKDLCTIDLLPEILEAGVYSLKLEGRMKQPAYTAGVTSIYRKYLDRLKEYGPENFRVEEEDRSRLKKIFSRGGSCSGYYKQHNGPDMIAFVNEKKTEEVPWTVHPAKRKITGRLELEKGQPARLQISAGLTTVSAEMGEVQEAKTEPAEKARVFQQLDRLGQTAYEWERLEIRMDDGCFVPMRLLNECRREAVEKLTDELLAPFRRKALPKKQIGRQERTTETISENRWKKVPEKGSEKIAEKGSEKIPDSRPSGRKRYGFYVSCETEEQAKTALMYGEVTGIYAPFDVMKRCMESGAAKRKELYLSLPHVVRENIPEEYMGDARKWLKEGMRGFLVRNLEAFAQLFEEGLAGYCVLDHSMYTWNNEAIDFWEKQGILRNTAPLELNAKELAHRNNENSELLIYGYLPMMLSAQCIRKNCGRCSLGFGSFGEAETKRQKNVWIRDRYQAEFPVQTVCDPWKIQNTADGKNCYNIIFNSLPFGLQGEGKAVNKLGMRSLRAAFTLENGEECRKILEELLQVFLHKGTPEEHAFTKGHFKRGAE